MLDISCNFVMYPNTLSKQSSSEQAALSYSWWWLNLQEWDLKAITKEGRSTRFPWIVPEDDVVQWVRILWPEHNSLRLFQESGIPLWDVPMMIRFVHHESHSLSECILKFYLSTSLLHRTIERHIDIIILIYLVINLRLNRILMK